MRPGKLGVELQRFGELRLAPIALSSDARTESAQLLNPILADSMILYAMYKKHHWLVAGRWICCGRASLQTASTSS